MALSKIDPAGLDIGQIGGRRNLIINGDFQVSQRGDYTSATSVTNATYYLDRWRGSIAGCSATIQDTGRKQKMVCTSGGTGTMRTLQIVEPQTINKFLGQKVTLSAKVTSNSSDCRLLSYMDGWQTESAVHSGGGTEETLSVTFTVPSSPISVEASYIIGIDGEQSANVNVNTNDYFEVTEVQLEVGTVATPFEHISYGEQLALCQRYYYKSIFAPISGYNPTTSRADGTVVFPVPMRDAPTALETTGTASDYTVYFQSGGVICNSIPTIASPTTIHGGYVRFNCPVSFVIGQGCLMAPYTTGAYLAWSAEL